MRSTDGRKLAVVGDMTPISRLLVPAVLIAIVAAAGCGNVTLPVSDGGANGGAGGKGGSGGGSGGAGGGGTGGASGAGGAGGASHDAGTDALPGCFTLAEAACKARSDCQATYCPGCQGGQAFAGCALPGAGAPICGG